MLHRGVLWPALLQVRSYWRYPGAVFALELLATPLLLLSPASLKIAVDGVVGDRPLPTVGAAAEGVVLRRLGAHIIAETRQSAWRHGERAQ